MKQTAKEKVDINDVRELIKMLSLEDKIHKVLIKNFDLAITQAKKEVFDDIEKYCTLCGDRHYFTIKKLDFIKKKHNCE